MNMQSQWFVIHTLAGQEQKVKESIEKRTKAEEMTDYIKEVLLDPQTAKRPYFDMKSLEMMVQTHTNGTRNYMNEINKAMSLELTYQLLIDA